MRLSGRVWDWRLMELHMSTPQETPSARVTRKFTALLLISAVDAHAIECILDDVLARRLQQAGERPRLVEWNAPMKYALLIAALSMAGCGEDRIKGSPFMPSVTVDRDSKICPDANGYLRVKICP